MFRTRVVPSGRTSSHSHPVRFKGLTTMSSPLHIPVIRSLPQLRRWRDSIKRQGLEVGAVPTMGALHEGHLDLVRASLARHDITILTLFVNPMQFAPSEDLSSYPRQIEQDLALLVPLLPSAVSTPPALRGLGISENEAYRPHHRCEVPSMVETETTVMDRDSAIASPLVVFAPSPDVMYPLKGELQDVTKHKGVEVDVRGWGDVLEGASRPQFFKGVATICTKLFNCVEPHHAYFGQKDIQQALLLKILVEDLLLFHPNPNNLHIIPTTRLSSGLALSSRNAYLTPDEATFAPTLYRALAAGAALLNDNGHPMSQPLTAEMIISCATQIICDEKQNTPAGVDLRLDYVDIFDKDSFSPVRGRISDRKSVLAGAIWLGKTRLIDNILLGWNLN